MEVGSFHMSLSEIWVLKFAKLPPRACQRLERQLRKHGYRGPRGEGKPIKLSDRRRKSIARHSGNRAKKVSGAGLSHRLPPLNHEAAAATGNEVVLIGRANTSRAGDASWPCRMSRTSVARQAIEGCGVSVGGGSGSGRRYATNLSCACGTAVFVNVRLTLLGLTFEDCRFLRNKHPASVFIRAFFRLP
jgi:hypothetical protein